VSLSWQPGTTPNLPSIFAHEPARGEAGFWFLPFCNELTVPRRDIPHASGDLVVFNTDRYSQLLLHREIFKRSDFIFINHRLVPERSHPQSLLEPAAVQQARFLWLRIRLLSFVFDDQQHSPVIVWASPAGSSHEGADESFGMGTVKSGCPQCRFQWHQQSHDPVFHEKRDELGLRAMRLKPI